MWRHLAKSFDLIIMIIIMFLFNSSQTYDTTWNYFIYIWPYYPEMIGVHCLIFARACRPHLTSAPSTIELKDLRTIHLITKLSNKMISTIRYQ